jgi:hypothetical protein
MEPGKMLQYGTTVTLTVPLNEGKEKNTRTAKRDLKKAVQEV